MEKVCIKNMGFLHCCEKMKLQLCFLKKPSLVISVISSYFSSFLQITYVDEVQVSCKVVN